jgi:hypothetical protein
MDDFEQLNTCIFVFTKIDGSIHDGSISDIQKSFLRPVGELIDCAAID